MRRKFLWALIAAVAVVLVLPATRTSGAPAEDVAAAPPAPRDVGPGVAGAAPLRERVIERLARSETLRGSEIDVEVRRGTALLSGSVLDDSKLKRAVQIARKTRGILRVDAEGLQQKPESVRSRWEEVPDQKLARRIVEALGADVFEDARVRDGWLFGWKLEGNGWQFDVDVDRGTATLEGSVPKRSDIALAIQRARRVSGVHAVYSELFVAFDPIRFPYPYYPPVLGYPGHVD